MPDAAQEHDCELLVFATPPAQPTDLGIVLDKKFVAGMEGFRALWKGPIRCALSADPAARPPFAESFALSALPFRASLVYAGENTPGLPALLEGASIVLATIEAANAAEIGRECRRRAIPCVFIAENTLATRVAIAILERQRAWPRRLKTALWHILTEPSRRRTLRLAAGIQANGAPAARAYGRLNPDTIAFFDTRSRETSLPGQDALETRLAGVAPDKPLRLAFSGRLDPIKGVDDLPRLMALLGAQGVAATLDIFGEGPLEGALQADIQRRGLSQSIRLHRAVDFDGVLTPFMKANVDMFVCCHRQADPSCTYLETLACGVPIAGYANEAFAGILNEADVGWAAPVGAVNALARKIRDAALSPGEIAAKSRNALTFARAHTFESAWARRIGQLRRLAGCDR